MNSSGVPWRYRFQYLSAGVNTGNGWETWQDRTLPPGRFAADYMTDSTTAPANYIPVFTYYELLQSSPSAGPDESTRDFNNLNNASTMGAYYASFKLLMQKAGASGRSESGHDNPDRRPATKPSPSSPSSSASADVSLAAQGKRRPPMNRSP